MTILLPNQNYYQGSLQNLFSIFKPNRVCYNKRYLKKMALFGLLKFGNDSNMNLNYILISQ